MRTVGITGPTGAGKTTALRAIRALGGEVFDCDEVYRELLGSSRELLAAIGERFPGAVRDGELDRRALAEVVFSDPGALAELTAMTQPRVVAEVRRRLKAAESRGCKLAAIDAIGLFESGADGLCDETVFITAPTETRLGRITERDGISRDAALARIGAQRGDEYFEALCDRKIVNNFPDSEGFFRHCLEIFQEDTNGRDQR